MKITILTLFPAMFDGFINTSIINRAIVNKNVEIEVIDFREYSLDKNKKVDDTPCGGGQGMILKCQPIVDCLRAIRTEKTHVVMLTPSGKTFKQKIAREYAAYEHIILLCGHYEGFDYRILDYVDEELSIGDYVLTGGEIAAMVVSDAIIRLLDGVIKKESNMDDSFENDLLEYPQYTRPIDYEGKIVPEVLLSGHHGNIEKWRLTKSIEITKEKRPDLLEKHQFTDNEKKILGLDKKRKK